MPVLDTITFEDNNAVGTSESNPINIKPSEKVSKVNRVKSIKSNKTNRVKKVKKI